MLDNLKEKKLILGSGSPRRRELIGNIISHFEVRVIDTDEHAPDHFGPAETAIHIAREKALAHAGSLLPNELVLTADTEVWMDGIRFGKAGSKKEAIET